MNLKQTYSKVEKVLSGVKFAAVIISLFTLALVVGTFVESYHGADYASRLIYKSWWFMAIEALMFVSIFMALVVRLPPKKRLYGFYTIHIGLMIIFIGSLFTYINGIDGSIQLLPNTPSKSIFINEDYLQITFPDKNKLLKLALPYTAHAVKIDEEIEGEGILIDDFYPFSKKELEWVPQEQGGLHSGKYLIFNENVSEEFVLSLNPNSDFKSTQTIGLLSLHYMPSILEKCLTTPSKSGFIVWNIQDTSCKTAEEMNIDVKQTPKKTRFISFNYEDKNLTFFPDFSPVAINQNKTKNLDSPFRVLSLNLFSQKANLFIFGESVAFYKKRKKKWILKRFSDFEDGLISLPWMSFKLSKIKFSDNSYPVEVPVATKPTQENGKIIAGDMKAVKLRFNDSTFWVRNDAPLEITNTKQRIRFEIVPKKLTLPYQITLDRFQMNKNPGTNDPASFESYVQLLDGRKTTGTEKHHVFMNNPLKYDDFTFYQSSYFPISQTDFASVFTVNYDPGRFFKYLGCILVVFGSFWHFILNRKKTRIKKVTT